MTVDTSGNIDSENIAPKNITSEDMNVKDPERFIVNPDTKKEVLYGFLYGLLQSIGIIASVAGIIVSLFNKLLGPIVWIVGTILIVFLLRRNLLDKNGKGFRIANIIFKSVFLFFSLALFILAYIIPSSIFV